MVIQNYLFFLFLSIVHASNECPAAYCDTNGPIIQFPFWLQGTQSQNCAPSGFKLSCNGQIYPILHITGSGDFYVTSVYYSIRSVTLQDVEGCLPTHLLSSDLSSTPFMAAKYKNYTFFSCPKGLGHVDPTRVMECASNATSDVFATNDLADSLKFSHCSKIASLPVPVSSYFDYGFPVDLELTWGVRDPAMGGKNKVSESSSATLIITIPTLFLLIVIVGFVCMKKQGRHHNSSSIQISEVSGLPSRGLDKSTIETYKKTTIGESRVGGPNGATCTICLTDYAPNDTIRSMPKCEHCFHVECIDEWLSMSRKCPICRISLPNTNSC